MLFSNPKRWAKAAVGSWWRFWLMGALLIFMQVQATVAAMDGGLRSALIAALMPSMFQVMFLYALRRVYRQAAGEEPNRAV